MPKQLGIFGPGESVHSLSEEESAGEMTWSRPNFDRQRIAAVLKHPHFFHKKRFHSASYSHSGANGLTIDGVPSDLQALTAAMRRSQVSSTRTLYGKNSKKSRDGRRFPNKRGGKSIENPTDELDEIALDHNDPDYDSDLEDPVTLETLSPSPTDEEFERLCHSILQELFIHGKTKDVVDILANANLAAHQRRRLPYLAITMALQHKQTQCELTSELISDLSGKVLNQAHVQQGFLLVLNDLGELVIDFPKASEFVARFIARAMSDDILPPKFIELQKSVLSHPAPVHCHVDAKNGLSGYNDSFSPSLAAALPLSDFNAVSIPGSDLPCRIGIRNLSDSSSGTCATDSERTAGTSLSSGIGSFSSLATSGVSGSEVALSALIRAENLLRLSHVFSRMDNIWGVPAGPRAMNLLVKKVQSLLRTYMDTGDLDEATEALLELDTPHFHHELVFQAIVMAIELSTDNARDRVIGLLKELCRSVVLTPNQLALGIRRVYSDLSDLQLDVPAAYTLMGRFVKDALKAGFLSKELASEMPARPRKRFISETGLVHSTGYSA